MSLHCAVPITDCLYLGSYSAIAKNTFLKENNIKYIVNATQVIPECHQMGVKTFRVQLDDHPSSDISKYFDKVADFIEERHQNGEKVLVHCVAGVSRSPTLVMAYLMKYKKLKLIDAHNLVKSKRQIIRPNYGFWSQLIDYEKTLFDGNTVKMVSTPMGLVPSLYELEVSSLIW